MNPLILIPARLAASRLPGKPLADIGGLPMIVHVLRRAQEAAVGPVAVACGDAAIAEAVRAAGGTAVLTDPALPSGSDRVWAALQALDPQGAHDMIINLQGDLPTLPPAFLAAVLRPLADPAVDIATLVAPVTSPGEAASESVVKAVCAFAPGATIGPALYFSRAALARFVALKPGALEQREKLEQLRALEAGMRIAVAQVDHAPFGVDTPADLERARRELAP